MSKAHLNPAGASSPAACGWVTRPVGTCRGSRDRRLCAARQQGSSANSVLVRATRAQDSWRAAPGKAEPKVPWQALGSGRTSLRRGPRTAHPLPSPALRSASRRPCPPASPSAPGPSEQQPCRRPAFRLLSQLGTILERAEGALWPSPGSFIETGTAPAWRSASSSSRQPGSAPLTASAPQPVPRPPASPHTEPQPQPAAGRNSSSLHADPARALRADWVVFFLFYKK